MFRGFLFRGWVTVRARAYSRRSGHLGGVRGHPCPIRLVRHRCRCSCIGLLLALVRWRSGSTLLTILMHVLINFWATVQSMIKVEWLP